MSLGFSIGDFITTTELCWKLYRQVYQVAKNAPAEVQSLEKELSGMQNVLRAIVEDVQNPGSPIAQAGADRVQLTNDIMHRTREVLDSLQKLLKKHDFKNADSRKLMLKRYWDQIKYAKEVRTIDGLRAKLAYQNGVLTLLLLAGNNSSLERIRSQNEKLISSVEEIRNRIYQPSYQIKIPIIDGQFDQQFQYELTRGLMAKAEFTGRPWSSIGIDSWVQAGKWWLMKAQAYLYSTNSGTEENCQAYVNLLKASWIMTDIIAAHPQVNFVSNGSQVVEMQHLSNAIKAEHNKVEQHFSVKPGSSQIMNADLNIWHPASATSLTPKLYGTQGQQPLSWKTECGEIMYQKFGNYRSWSTGLEVECIIILEMNVGGPAINLIAQTVEGQDVLRFDLLDWRVPLDLSISAVQGGLFSVSFVPDPKEGVKGNPETLTFLDFEDARQLNLLLEHIPKFQSEFPASPLEFRSLYGGALFRYLQIVHEEGKDLSETRIRKDIQLLCEKTMSSDSQEKPLDLWNFAIQASGLSGCPPHFEDPRRQLGHPTSLLSIVCWTSPTADCFLAIFDYIVPKTWCGRAQYVGEIVQAAIYRQDEIFLLSVLKHLECLPEAIETNIPELMAPANSQQKI